MHCVPLVKPSGTHGDYNNVADSCHGPDMCSAVVRDGFHAAGRHEPDGKGSLPLSIFATNGCREAALDYQGAECLAHQAVADSRLSTLSRAIPAVEWGFITGKSIIPT